jgi:multiple antibiotic resistance protein
MQTTSFFAIAISLFLVLNAIGNIPLFVSLLTKFPVSKQRTIILREMLIALGILLIFTFFGDVILELLGISQAVIGIGGGILLFIIALGMIFPKQDEINSPREEPLIVPLAMPLVAGPGTISAVMVYSEHVQNGALVAGALTVAWIPSLLILLLSANIRNYLGEKGLAACARLGGMLLTLISVQMFTRGFIILIHDNFPKVGQ